MTFVLSDKLALTESGCIGISPSVNPLLGSFRKAESVERLNSGLPGTTPRSPTAPALATWEADKRLSRLSILDSSSAVPLNRTKRSVKTI